jgi:shikimate dehydrogenase
MYNGLFRERGVDAVYEAREVGRGGAAAAIRRLSEEGYLGVNVTSPLKYEAAEAVGWLDEDARETGAVNTVLLKGPGGPRGFNTDWLGVAGPLRDVAGLRSPVDVALVLGAGGGGASALYAVARALGGAREVYVVSRTGATARALAERASRLWGLDARPLTPREAPGIMPRAELVVNATPAGWGDGRPPVEPLSFRPGCVALDMVYDPLLTEFLARAGEYGCVAVDGLWMLVYQAAENLKIWLGMDVSPLELRMHAAGALRARRGGGRLEG